MIAVLVTVTAGYLLGSIPVANIIASRRDAADLRDVGDRNPGYWNARAILGRRAAMLVFVGDVAKGAAAAGIGAILATPGVWGLAYVGAGAAMVGHAFPVFAGFRGGRSISTFVGGALVFAPLTAAAAILVLIAVFLVRRSFALAARVGFVAFPFIQLAIDGPNRTAVSGVLMTFIGLRFLAAHRHAASA